MINLRFSETLLSKTRRPGPNVRLDGFYDLSRKIVSRLNDCGYDTSDSVCFATVSNLEADGFKRGQINQLKRMLDSWSSIEYGGENDSLSGYHCLDDQFTFFRRNSSIEKSTSWTKHED